jgi:hypothetical protein
MRLYVIYVLVVASILIAAIAAVPNLSDRLRRFLSAAVSLLVMLPALLYLVFGGV